MSSIVASIVRVPPTEAAKRLRHMLYSRDIGVVMATEAKHHLGDISRTEPSPAAFHREEKDVYVGNFLEGLGLMDARFPKSGCRLLTESELVALVKNKLGIRGPLP